MSALVGAEGLARRFRFSAHVPIDLREPLQRREEAVVARLRIWAGAAAEIVAMATASIRP
jgi:hypothetical protein